MLAAGREAEVVRRVRKRRALNAMLKRLRVMGNFGQFDMGNLILFALQKNHFWSTVENRWKGDKIREAMFKNSKNSCGNLKKNGDMERGKGGQFQEIVREGSTELDDYLYCIRESESGYSDTDSWVKDGTCPRDRGTEGIGLKGSR